MNIRQYYTGICLHHAPYFMIEYCENYFNRTRNKQEICIYRTLDKVLMQDIFVNLSCINRLSVYSERKSLFEKNLFRHVSPYTCYDTDYSFLNTLVHSQFLVWVVLLNLQFYVYVLQIVLCPFVLFGFTIVLSILLQLTDSDYPFGIFKLFLSIKT